MVRLSLFALATAAIMMISSSTVHADDDASEALNVVEQATDEAGKVFNLVHGGTDEDGDDDDDTPQRRSNKHKSSHKNKHKSSRKSKKLNFSIGSDIGAKLISDAVQITWYASQDLKNPQCGDGSWNPDNNSHIGAVMAGWDGGPKCGEFVQLCNKDVGNKCVKVRIVDKCAGCNKNAVDLTKSAFKKLAKSGLDDGRIHNVHLFKTQTPEPFNIDLFGPFKLKKN